MNPEQIEKYLAAINSRSDFKAFLGDRGGYITFSNSGKRGSIKSFTLGLDSFKSIFTDIKNNLTDFQSHQNYNETEWRDLGSRFYNDEPSDAMATVQTKPLFTTLGKLISWANNYNISDYSDHKIVLSEDALRNTIEKLETLASLFAPKENYPSVSTFEKTMIVSEKELKRFTYEAFKILLDEYGEEKVLRDAVNWNSKINETEYTGLKIKSYFGSGNLIGVFENEQDKDSLSSSNTPRYFEDNLSMNKYDNAYFSTQWADVDSGTLTFKNFSKFVSDLTEGDFEVTKEGDQYTLFQNTKSIQITLQKIFYGAPGTGKSYAIETILSGIPENQKERITFHPEYDHSSFVGGYKPFTERSSDSDTEEIKYKFVPQVFTNIYIKAWQNPYKDYYLAIEEINRGNCAEIFGDLFQLLDRNSNYSVSPSEELRTYLERNLTDEKAKQGIAGGKIKLPANLHLLASMNTSDQSLFPMDSAFKRRWTWEYVPINYAEKNEAGHDNESFNYDVKITDQLSFRWIEFIEKINAIIKSDRNLGSDKCIGNYFIKPFARIITLEEFINKVVFYLWLDVFKDEDDSVFQKIDKDISYEDFFPIKTKGKDAVIKLLGPEILDVKISDSSKDEVTGTKSEE